MQFAFVVANLQNSPPSGETFRTIYSDRISFGINTNIWKLLLLYIHDSQTNVRKVSFVNFFPERKFPSVYDACDMLLRAYVKNSNFHKEHDSSTSDKVSRWIITLQPLPYSHLCTFPINRGGILANRIGVLGGISGCYSNGAFLN